MAGRRWRAGRGMADKATVAVAVGRYGVVALSLRRDPGHTSSKLGEESGRQRVAGNQVARRNRGEERAMAIS